VFSLALPLARRALPHPVGLYGGLRGGHRGLFRRRGRLRRKFTSMSPQEQTNAGDGVKIIGRWHNVAARTGVVIFESNAPAAVQRYLGLWNP
jgi:hypothetical protein